MQNGTDTKSNSLLGKAESLENLVNYREGSVVSRTILKQKSGNITLFAFDKGEELSEHTTPFDAFVYIIEGEAAITISGKQQILTKGDMIIMPAGKPHAVYAQKRFKMALVMIK